MAKPWARYEVGFINHPKFKLLTGNAIALWVEGKNHADEHLTDGFLPMGVVKGFRFYSKQAMTMLTTSIGPKDSTGELYAPLWEPAGTGGVMMHDYLGHNPAGDTVRARQDAAEERRKQERERKRQWRDRKGQRRGTDAPVPPDVPTDATGQGRDGDASVRDLSRSNTDTDTDLDTEKNVPPNPPEGDRRASRDGAMGTGTLPRDHMRHAWCDRTFSRCVPQAVHAKLTNQLAPKHGGDRGQTAAALLAWYPTIVASLPPDAVMGEEFRFWQAHFDAAFAAPLASSARKPETRTTVPDADETKRRMAALRAEAV